MEPRKLNVAFVGFPYGGNGGTSSETPDIRNWMIPTVIACKNDPRIGEIAHRDFSDTPITMTRNAAVAWAKQAGVDVLVMIDSDQSPDMYVGCDHTAKPFFESSFDFLHAHYDKGPVAIFAPYCGPPGHPTRGGYENVYVFKWQASHSGEDRDEFKLDPYDRDQAFQMSGIQEAAAGPTGLCMIDMRCFDHIPHPYFYYQFEDEGELCPHCHRPEPGPQSEKATTEDVAFFRDLSLSVQANLGYNPVFCNWDAWAGHWKPKCVGKPILLMASQVSDRLVKAYSRGGDHLHKVTQVRAPNGMDLSKIPFARNPDPQGTVVERRGKRFVIPDLLPTANMDETDKGHLRELVQQMARMTGVNNAVLRMVEVGSWVGWSAMELCRAASEFTEFELHCVDHFQGGVATQKKAAREIDIHAEFLKNTAEFRDSITVHRGSSVDMAQAWAEQEETRIDFLFIDADHSYEACLADIRAWEPFVCNGGIVVGHDYSFAFPGVKRAVHEYFGWDVITAGSLWIIRKGEVSVPQVVYERNGKA